MTIQQPTTKQGAKGCMMGANDCLLTHLSDDGCFFSLSFYGVYPEGRFFYVQIYIVHPYRQNLCVSDY